jgi:ferritin-like metal-binding protein YciE
MAAGLNPAAATAVTVNSDKKKNMKQSTTTARSRGRKASGAAAAQHRTGGRPSAALENDSPRSNNGASRGDNSTSRGSTASSSRTTTGDAAGHNGTHQKNKSQSHSFTGETHLEKFFLAQLKDIYYAEKKIVQSLPKMQEATTTDELKEAFEDHLNQTQRHIKRLEKVFNLLNQHAEGEKCEAIEGIAREVDNIIGETEEGTLTRDAALIIAAQKVEHYEIATYGGLVQLAITMGLHEAADLLDKTLVEEEDTDARLTEIAENDINLGAEHEDSQGAQESHAQG